MNRRLTPMMEACLRAMTRAPLERYREGWKPIDGRDGVWNSHTTRWLARIGYAAIAGNRARIESAGRYAISRVDEVGA